MIKFAFLIIIYKIYIHDPWCMFLEMRENFFIEIMREKIIIQIIYDRFLNWYRINDILKKYLYSCCCMILSIDLVQREMWTFSIVLPRLLLIIGWQRSPIKTLISKSLNQ